MKKPILIIISTFIFFISSSAQTNSAFLTEVPIDPAKLSGTQKSMVDRIHENKTYEKVQYVVVENLSNLIQPNGEFTFSIPGRTGSITATPTHVNALSQEDYEWYGTVKDGVGSIIILSQKGKITASISLLDEEYEILKTDDDYSLLISYDMEVAKEEKICGTINGKSKNDKNDSTTITPQTIIRPCADYVRVLVLYTLAARNAVADINQTIDLCISQFSSTVYNSNITSRTVVELAGRQQSTFVETTSGTNDLVSLRTDPNAQAARNNTNADFVILLTNGSYGSLYGAAATVEPDNNLSYAIVQVSGATGNRKSFVHESGHLYGCRHDDDAMGQPYARGYIFSNGVIAYYTIMVNGVTITGSRYRLLNFSNPNVSINGRPTGTTTTNNNARRITETFPTLINFRPPVFRSLSALISGPEYGQAYTTVYTWEADVTCGAAPYTFEWRTSSDGFNYSGVRGTAGTFSDRLTCPPGNYYYVRLDVRSSDGQTSSHIQNVLIDKSPCQPHISKLSGGQIMEDEAIASYIQLNNAFPNPFSQSTLIEFSLPKATAVTLEVFDVYGKKMQTIINGRLPAGKHNRTLNGLKNGVYFYRLSTDNFEKTKSLIVQ